MYLSTRWKNSSVALTTMLGIWMLWTVFLPSILFSAIENRYPLPSRAEFTVAMKEDRAKGIDGHNPKDERAKVLVEQTLQEYGVDSLGQLPINFDGIRMQADEEYGNEVWDKHFGNLSAIQTKQKQTFQFGGIVNPFIALQNSSMGFAGSDNLHHQEFLVQVEQYRRSLLKTLNDEHAYGGSRTGEWAWKAGNDFYKSIADFNYVPIPISSVIPSYMLDLLLLQFWVVFILFLLFRGAKKMQIV
jgi:ABC-2 type transport system permease protein